MTDTEQTQEELTREIKRSWSLENTTKTPNQVEEEMKRWFEQTRIEWKDHLEDRKENYILGLRLKDSGVREEVEKVLIWIDEALKKDEIAGWREFYTKWNGNSDISRDKYDGNKDLVGRLSDLRLYLEAWERSSREQTQQEWIQKLRDALQTIGINPDDKNMQEKVEKLNKIRDDLDALGIDESRVKETIEKERNEQKTKDEWLIDNYFGENRWKEIQAQIEIEGK